MHNSPSVPSDINILTSFRISECLDKRIYWQGHYWRRDLVPIWSPPTYHRLHTEVSKCLCLKVTFKKCSTFYTQRNREANLYVNGVPELAGGAESRIAGPLNYVQVKSKVFYVNSTWNLKNEQWNIGSK
jgi:hypothetical protein